MSAENTQGLIHRDKRVLYDLFLRHYLMVEEIVKEHMPASQQETMAPLLVVGVFRRFFDVFPEIVAENETAAASVYLQRIAVDSCVRYKDNLEWISETQARLEVTKEEATALAPPLHDLIAATKYYGEFLRKNANSALGNMNPLHGNA